MGGWEGLEAGEFVGWEGLKVGSNAPAGITFLGYHGCLWFSILSAI